MSVYKEKIGRKKLLWGTVELCQKISERETQKEWLRHAKTLPGAAEVWGRVEPTTLRDFCWDREQKAAATTAGKSTREYAGPRTSDSRSIPRKSLSPTLSLRAKVPVAGGEAGEPRDTSIPRPRQGAETNPPGSPEPVEDRLSACTFIPCLR